MKDCVLKTTTGWTSDDGGEDLQPYRKEEGGARLAGWLHTAGKEGR